MPAGSLLSHRDLEEVLARTMPDVLALLADGSTRSRREILAALADRHERDDVKHALMRLAVTGRLVQRGATYALAAEGEG
jgi:hypothetical protein